MPLHPQAKAFLEKVAAENPPAWFDLPLDEARTRFHDFDELAGDGADLARVEDHEIEGRIPVRLYADLPSIAGTLPVVMYFHGGGWVLGDLDSHDVICRNLAKWSGCAVVSVHYRRPPEDPYPAAFEECVAATKFMRQCGREFGLDGGRILVAGDSAGGNLAAAVALKSLEMEELSLAGQVLIYPVLSRDFARQSYNEFAEGHGLTKETMGWFWEQYLPTEQSDQFAEPFLAETLKGLPPTFLMTAEYDVLRDEGEVWANALQQQEVPTTFRRYDGMLHGFVHLAGEFDDGVTALRDCAVFVRECLGEPNAG